jgi:hypothetical protein
VTDGVADVVRFKIDMLMFEPLSDSGKRKTESQNLAEEPAIFSTLIL